MSKHGITGHDSGCLCSECHEVDDPRFWRDNYIRVLNERALIVGGLRSGLEAAMARAEAAEKERDRWRADAEISARNASHYRTRCEKAVKLLAPTGGTDGE